MDEFCWERSMSFPWSNINHHQQETEESNLLGSENIFLNPITASVGRLGSHRQLAPTRLDSMNVASSLTAASQYWCQPLAVNGLREGKNVIPSTTTTAAATSLESLDCLLPATNSNAYMSPDHEDGISVIFSDYKNLYKNLSDVSSDDSATKNIDDGVVSQCSSEKKPNNSSGFYENNPPRSKRPRSDPLRSTINFRQATESDETDSEVITQKKEMIYRAAAFRPVSFAGEEVVEKPRRKNVRISSDPQTVAARKRRERVSERIRVLQKLVPGGGNMDTASLLDEAANYLKFLRSQVKALEQFGQNLDYMSFGTTTYAHGTTQNNVTLGVPLPLYFI